jgi:transcriptional antiterminator RfaH
MRDGVCAEAADAGLTPIRAAPGASAGALRRVVPSMPYWVAVRSAPSHERLAWEGVGQAGFETFIPKIRIRIGAQWRTQPLFGCYFFVRVVDRWRVLERTMGVLTVVKFGAAPARCPDEEIAALLERSDRDGIIRLAARPSSLSRRVLAPGAHVAIAGGPFRGFEAIHTGMTAHERELVLINLLGRQTTVAVPAGLIRSH